MRYVVLKEILKLFHYENKKEKEISDAFFVFDLFLIWILVMILVGPIMFQNMVRTYEYNKEIGLYQNLKGTDEIRFELQKLINKLENTEDYNKYTEVKSEISKLNEDLRKSSKLETERDLALGKAKLLFIIKLLFKTALPAFLLFLLNAKMQKMYWKILYKIHEKERKIKEA